MFAPTPTLEQPWAIIRCLYTILPEAICIYLGMLSQNMIVRRLVCVEFQNIDTPINHREHFSHLIISSAVSVKFIGRNFKAWHVCLDSVSGYMPTT